MNSVETEEMFDEWRRNDPSVNLVDWPNSCCPGCPGGSLWKSVTQALGKNVVMSDIVETRLRRKCETRRHRNPQL